MTVFGICFEWLITFIEITLGHYFMSILFEEQYSKKKQRIVYLVVISVTTTGVILLNLNGSVCNYRNRNRKLRFV